MKDKERLEDREVICYECGDKERSIDILNNKWICPKCGKKVKITIPLGSVR